MVIPASCITVFPVNVEGITYATAQLVAKRDGKLYLMQVKGVPTEIKIDGKTLKNVKPKGSSKPVYKNIYLLTEEVAQRLFLEQKPTEETTKDVAWKKIHDAGLQRTIIKGPAKVAEAPTDDDFRQAAVYEITVPTDEKGLLEIQYQGDCARLYADGKLIADNFYNGRSFYYGLWRLSEGTQKLELRILPMQPNAPIYFPKEADRTVEERIITVKIYEKIVDG
jgi:hypothetical protein